MGGRKRFKVEFPDGEERWYYRDDVAVERDVDRKLDVQRPAQGDLVRTLDLAELEAIVADYKYHYPQQTYKVKIDRDTYHMYYENDIIALWERSRLHTGWSPVFGRRSASEKWCW